MGLEDQMKQAAEYQISEADKVLLKANILMMNIAFEDKNYKTAAETSKAALDIAVDNPKAKFILFWSNYRLNYKSPKCINITI